MLRIQGTLVSDKSEFLMNRVIGVLCYILLKTVLQSGQWKETSAHSVRQIVIQSDNRNYVLISVIVYEAAWRVMERMIKARTKIIYTFFSP